MADRLVSTMTNFGYVISAVCAKQLPEPMQALVTCLQVLITYLQGKLAQVSFWV